MEMEGHCKLPYWGPGATLALKLYNYYSNTTLKITYNVQNVILTLE